MTVKAESARDNISAASSVRMTHNVRQKHTGDKVPPW
jgi:hypothetical protein